MFTVIPSTNGYFMLPTEAAKYLKLAGAAQLKVLIAVYKNMGIPTDENEIAKQTGLSADDTKDALLFWQEKGLIANTAAVNTDSSSPSGATEKPTQNGDNTLKKATETPTEQPKRIPPVKPTTTQINSRCKESPEIKELFLQAQSILGRTIGIDTQAQLLMCCDYLGLPVYVVLMICEYCRSIGKTGISYITRLAEDWAEEGITTLEAANRKISALEESSKIWAVFSAHVGITTPSPSKSQSNYIYKWISVYGFSLDVILLAYDEMADHITKFSMAYIDKTLSSWHEKQLKTVIDVKKYLSEYKKSNADKNHNTGAHSPKKAVEPVSGKTSYDINAAEAKAAMGAPIYERKKKK